MDNGDDVVLTIDLHYVMDKVGLHDMDAGIHNKCGACIIDVINHLGDVLGEDYQLDFSATQEGGVRDIYKLILKSRVGHEIFIGLISALITHFIGVAPSVDESQKQLNRIELLERLKNGQYTDEELEFVLSGDSRYIESRNNFYKNIDKEPNVKSVRCKATGESLPRDLPEAMIEKKDIEVLMGPMTTEADRIIVDALLKPFPNAKVGVSKSWGKLRSKQ